MQFKSIEKIHTGAFLHRYNVNYVNQFNDMQCYEMVSRRADLDCLSALRQHTPDAVVMVIRDEADEHMLLIREFRMELGCEIYGLPGGLIEQGETPEQTALRELKEETGLSLCHIENIYPPAACTVGIGDEQTICIFGRAHGELRDHWEGSEEIHAAWYTREEILSLQQHALFGSWAMAYSRIWAENPFLSP